MIDYFAQNLWQFWAIFSILCLILELSNGDFFIVCFAVGGLFGLASSFIFPSFYAQIAVTLAFSLLSIFLVRPTALKYLHRGDDARPSNAEALIGRIGTVSEAIEAGGFGRVAIDGDDWKAQAVGGAAVAKGAKVEVVGMESIILSVVNRESAE